MTPPQAAELSRLLGSAVSHVSAVGGGDICQAYRVESDDGRTIFVKTLADAPEGFFETEAEGLRMLRAARDGVATPAVIAVDHGHLALEWITPGPPSAKAAERFGRALAATHRNGAEQFGSARGDGWVGTLRLPGGPWPDWPQMWAQGRVGPYLRAAHDGSAISKRDVTDVERVLEVLADIAGPPEPPSLLHGDLWAGNVIWGADGRNWLVDPAAHGGHRESDLAMLALFGLPHLDRVIASYHEVWPLATGWRERVGLHQLHPILVHAVLFGGSYGARAGQLARDTLRALT